MSIQNSGLNYVVYITLDIRTDHTKSVLSRMLGKSSWRVLYYGLGLVIPA